MNRVCSIFNEVIGPVMSGPSSSHTAGPNRISNYLRMISPKQISRVEIIMDKDGSYPATYIGQGSDRGFIGGFLGIETSDVRQVDALQIAGEMDFEYNFFIDDIGATHPNAAVIKAYCGSELVISALTHSIGGGMFEIVKIDDIKVNIFGDYSGYIFKTRKSYTLVEDIKRHIDNDKTDVIVNESDEYMIIELKTYGVKYDNLFNTIVNHEDYIWGSQVESILPTASTKDISLPYDDVESLKKFCLNNELDLNDIGMIYEMAVGNVSEDTVINKMSDIVNVMKNSAEEALAGNARNINYLSPKSSIMQSNINKTNIVDMGVLEKVMLYSTAVMEYNNGLGVIVAAPTAGSAGVLPASIIAVGDSLGKSKVDIAKAMLVSGFIGVIIYNKATFAAEVAACQAENGSASAMAAAGVVSLLGGSIDQAFKASGLAMQNMLGLVCDPIAGLAAIPCVNRNSIAACNAVTSANMVMLGYDPIIPFEETVKAMYEVGKILPSELRCTGNGGLCITCTGKKINKNHGENCD